MNHGSDAGNIAIRQLTADEVDLFPAVDRSEEVKEVFAVQDGRLVTRPHVETIRGWRPGSLEKYLPIWRAMVKSGDASLIGAFDQGDRLTGLAIVRTIFRPAMTQLAALYVDARFRRRGVARLLTDEMDRLARASGAKSVYVSASPTGGTVAFYQAIGFEPVSENDLDPELHELEPNDIHMIKPLAVRQDIQ